jgi:hypothetical protein
MRSCSRRAQRDGFGRWVWGTSASGKFSAAAIRAATIWANKANSAARRDRTVGMIGPIDGCERAPILTRSKFKQR